MLRTIACTLLFLILVGCRSGPESTQAAHAAMPTEADARDDVWRVLHSLHEQASRADFDAYFDLFAPGAVFLGTDATERWSLEEFKKYAMPHFRAAVGWTYTLIDTRRYITFSADGATAWFDEALHNEKLGECRGTGVLVRTPKGWKIAQYNLTMPVPNEMILNVADEIRHRE
ncbi:MAG: nuclear transport factor 2 family protein [Phycisphaeraceae bacterium]|nr:nuclear transport factor 2 family protein [Phycisphaeraceae bacterium]